MDFQYVSMSYEQIIIELLILLLLNIRDSEVINLILYYIYINMLKRNSDSN